MRKTHTREVTDVELEEARAGDVLVRFVYAGLCHSDEHLWRSHSGDMTLVGRHEGAAIVEAVGTR